MQVGSDTYYKSRIIEIANAAELKVIASDLEQLFRRVSVPSPDGAMETIAVLGDGLDAVLTKSKRVVEGVDHFAPGFIRWLGSTGWGNNLYLIKILCAWQLEAERKKWLHKAKKPH